MNLPAMTLVALSLIPSTPQPSSKDVLYLSRIAVSESEWDSPEDHAAIYLVIRSVQRKMSAKSGRPIRFSTAAGKYSKYATGEKAPQNDRQAWVQRLGERSHKYQSRFVRVMERSRAIFRGDLKPACETHPDHWGGGVDIPRAKRFGFIEIDCGNTLNHFYLTRNNARALGFLGTPLK